MSEIYLMKCSDDRKRIMKTPSNVLLNDASISMHLKEPTSIISPVLTLSKSKIGDQWASVNYAYIPEFGRYYFVDKIECLTHDQLELSLTVDVLYTYRSQLLSTSFEIARSQKINSKYYVDTEKALINRRVVTYEIFGSVPQSTTGKKYMLTVAGGV